MKDLDVKPPVKDKILGKAQEIKDGAKDLAERISHSQPVVYAKTAFGKMKLAFSKWQVAPSKKIVCLDLGGKLICLHGYVYLDRKSGVVVVKLAEKVEYVFGSDEVVVQEKIVGTPYFPIDKMVFCVDLPKK